MLAWIVCSKSNSVIFDCMNIVVMIQHKWCIIFNKRKKRSHHKSPHSFMCFLFLFILLNTSGVLNIFIFFSKESAAAINRVDFLPFRFCLIFCVLSWTVWSCRTTGWSTCSSRRPISSCSWMKMLFGATSSCSIRTSHAVLLSWLSLQCPTITFVVSDSLSMRWLSERRARQSRVFRW